MIVSTIKPGFACHFGLGSATFASVISPGNGSMAQKLVTAQKKLGQELSLAQDGDVARSLAREFLRGLTAARDEHSCGAAG